jgi:putative Mg2+ transporter-C (MgtC) family protein
MPVGHYNNESFQDFLSYAGVYWPRIVSAIVAGGLIGAENQIYGKSAGLRTSLLVTLACCVITIVSIETAYILNGSPDRITAQIITGIGFIGGGVILQQRGKIHGITTAASIFVSAGIGIVAGTGYIFTAVAIAIVAFVILLLLRPVDYFIDHYYPFLRLREINRHEGLARRQSKRIVEVPKDIRQRNSSSSGLPGQ